MGRALAFSAALGLALAANSQAARADGLGATETSRLMRGETVSRSQELVRGSRRYVGGITYTIVDASPDDLAAVLGDMNAWRRFLPRTRNAERVGSAGDDPLVRVTHGSALVRVAYTLRVHRDGRVVRFWMDPSRTHDIEDAWGFFRSEPLPDGRTLVTYGILIDMGDGILRDMFEPRVRELALEVPDHVRDVLMERQAHGRSAAR
jgi:hypothetical protein